MRRAGTAAALAAAAVLALCAGTAWGHTEVARFVPGKGAMVSTPVKVVGVRFEGPVVTGLLTLTTASGRTGTASRTPGPSGSARWPSKPRR
jgi:methionine-rich copper-binding protein CopC